MQPGDVYTDFIEVRISNDGPTGFYINNAEIGRIYDVNNIDVSNNDSDSSADNIFGNDSGGQPVTSMDDFLLGTGVDLSLIHI